MRILVDLADDDVAALNQAARRKGQSRASLIRQAVTDYLAERPAGGLKDAFGAWKGRGEDGLEYQRRLRDEW